MVNIVISDKERWDKKIKKLIEDGKDKLHVLADFDRTFTKAYVRGQKSPTIIAQIRNGDYLTPDYSSRAHALFNHYHPIEVDTNVSFEEKNEKMNEWWRKHFDLLIECGLTKDVMKEIIEKRTLKLRKGALELIDILQESSIPLIIMSAGPGDMIKMFLEQEKRLYSNVYVIANFLKFDKNEKAIGVEEPIIHSCNKHEIEIKSLDAYKELLKRKNVLLIGDGIEDLGMIEGFSYKTLATIGFYNERAEDGKEKYEQGLKEFKEKYDVVILNDSEMDFVNRLVRRVK
jgi:HAD superfamily hydrolase (TIGR01544 family)